MDIKKVRARVTDLTAETTVLLEKWQSLADDLRSEFDEKSEKWQESEKGEEWQCVIDDIESQVNSLEFVAGFEV